MLSGCLPANRLYPYKISLFCMRRIRSFAIVLLLEIFHIGGLSVAFAQKQDRLPFSPNVSPQDLPETALIETTKGPFEIKFFREDAPITVKNFEYLGRKGFYEGLLFRRYIPNFIIQAGDPLNTGEGGPGYTLPGEFSRVKHEKGSVGMARLPNPVNSERRSNGSQFYITLDRAPHLDGFYTIFGQVVNGMDIVTKLRPEDKIVKVRFPRNDAPPLGTGYSPSVNPPMVDPRTPMVPQ